MDSAAPWHVVAAESKRYARVRVLEIVIEAIEQSLRELDREPVDIDASL